MWGCGVETLCNPCTPSLGRALRRGAGTPTPWLWHQVTDPPVLGTASILPPEAADAQPGDAADGSARGSASPGPSPGLVPPPAGPGGSWLGKGQVRGQVLPTCALSCPAKVSWGSHAVPRPSPAHGSSAPAPVGTVPLPGIAGSPWHHPSFRGDSGSHPARRPLTWVLVARAGARQGRGRAGLAAVPVCPPCRCARRSCCRCHLHTTDSSCSSGAEP